MGNLRKNLQCFLTACQFPYSSINMPTNMCICWQGSLLFSSMAETMGPLEQGVSVWEGQNPG